MKIEKKESTLKTNALDASVTEHSINKEDQAKLMEILATSLYSDGHLAAVREPLCNAYDAMYESGNNNYKSIVVSLPNELNPTFSVSDNGTGIADVSYITSLGKSSKDSSDKFIGGFGIGFNAPFCVTNAITFINVYNGLEQTFVSTKDGSKISCINVNTRETDQPNGFTVQFGIDLDGVSKIRNRFIGMMKYIHPDIRPTIKGLDNEPDYYVGYNDDFKCYYNELYSEKVTNVLVDKVLYKFDNINLTNENKDFLNKFRHTLIIKSNVGDVELTPNREQLSLSNKTIDFINSEIDKIRSNVLDHIDKLPSTPKNLEEFDKINTVYQTCGSLLKAKQRIFVSCGDYTFFDAKGSRPELLTYIESGTSGLLIDTEGLKNYKPRLKTAFNQPSTHKFIDTYKSGGKDIITLLKECMLEDDKILDNLSAKLNDEDLQEIKKSLLSLCEDFFDKRVEFAKIRDFEPYKDPYARTHTKTKKTRVRANEVSFGNSYHFLNKGNLNEKTLYEGQEFYYITGSHTKLFENSIRNLKLYLNLRKANDKGIPVYYIPKRDLNFVVKKCNAIDLGEYEDTEITQLHKVISRLKKELTSKHLDMLNQLEFVQYIGGNYSKYFNTNIGRFHNDEYVDYTKKETNKEFNRICRFLKKNELLWKILSDNIEEEDLIKHKLIKR